MRRRYGLAICGAALLAGCAAHGPNLRPRIQSTTPPPTAALESALDCNAIDNRPPPRDRAIVLGTVALPARKGSPALQIAHQPAPSHGVLTYFAKDGLGFRAGSRWRLAVPKDAQAHLRIGWGSPAVPSTGVRPPATCPRASRTGWLWYPGGYWTDKPGCYPVVVEVDEHVQRVQIGVGAPCPHQG